MSTHSTYPVLIPDLQVEFYFRLQGLKKVYLIEALNQARSQIKISEIDRELALLVPESALQKVASFSLRGENLFPVPSLLALNPQLLGYYRLLLGFSQKEFYSKGPFAAFKSMEESGRISKAASDQLRPFCISLIESAKILVDTLPLLALEDIHDLQVLTLGPQLRGSKNNDYGQIATKRVFDLIGRIAFNHIVSSTEKEIRITNDTGREVIIRFAADPDIEIVEALPSGSRGLISIEIKGGKDLSNIHNRIGEAEKSHQKAKSRGYVEFMTILSVETDYRVLKSESPTTTHFFNLEKITGLQTEEHKQFKDLISSILSIR